MNSTMIQGALGASGGSNRQAFIIANVFKTLSAVNTNAEITIWTPAAGKKFRLMGILVTTTVAGNLLFKDNTAGTTIFIVPAMIGGAPTYISLGNGILSATAGNVLTCTGAAASTTSGTVWGVEE